MQIAPLMHSRTLYCDFIPNFAVRPADLDVSWAMKKVLQSTSDIDILNGARLLTAYKGNMGIVGIACKFRYFIEKYVPEVVEEAQKYFQDEAGREIKIFIGCVFKGNGVPDVSYKDLWQMCKENFVPQWESKVPKTKISDYKEFNSKNIGVKISPTENIDGVEFYLNGADNEKILAQSVKEHKNFCSNVDQFKIILSGEFNSIVTSKSNIDRFKSEAAQKKTPLTNRDSQTSTTSPFHQAGNTPVLQDSENSDNKMNFIIGVTAAAILAVIIYLTM